MQYRLSKPIIIELIAKARAVKSNDDLAQLIYEDARIISLFRLNVSLDRVEFSQLLKKEIGTISNLENGTKKITTLSKARRYAEVLRDISKSELEEEKILIGFENWKNMVENNRAERAKNIAHLGGSALANKLSKHQRYLRAKIAGLAASKKSAGFHKYKDKWMEWSKKGLRNAGKRTAVGPNNELMANDLEANTAKSIIAKGFEYKYEPRIVINKKNYYPDFLVGNTIIECCYWEKEDRWSYLSRKIKDFAKKRFNCIIVTKYNCSKFLSLLPKNTMYLFEEGLKDLALYLPNRCQPPR